MRIHLRPIMWLPVAGLIAASTWAQNSSQVGNDHAPLTREQTPQDRHTQRIERIRVEDANSRIDELRVGGETQSITVQPKTSVPAYQVRPADATGRNSPEAAPGTTGPRTWKIFDF